MHRSLCGNVSNNSVVRHFQGYSTILLLSFLFQSLSFPCVVYFPLCVWATADGFKLGSYPQSLSMTFSLALLGILYSCSYTQWLKVTESLKYSNVYKLTQINVL